MGRASLLTLDHVRSAARVLGGVAARTPLIELPALSEEIGFEVRLKAESLQRSGSFKFRGAYHHLAVLPSEERSRGVITYSSGNHAQAVALSASLAGVRSVVVMPVTAPAVKREGAARYGAEVVLEGTMSSDRRERAEAIAEAEGLHMIPPYDDPDIITGQGTAALEAAESWPEMDGWLVPIGGGGLAAGSGVALRGIEAARRGLAAGGGADGGRPFRVVGVEPEGADAMRRSLDAGRPVSLDRVDTIADGLAPDRPGDLPFRHVQAHFDDIVTVSDDEIRETARDLLLRLHVFVEFSGAAAVAALRSGRTGMDGRRVGVLLSGGNMDPAILAELLPGGSR